MVNKLRTIILVVLLVISTTGAFHQPYDNPRTDCGDGRSGYRVQLVYMHPITQPPRLTEQFHTIQNIATRMNKYVVDASSGADKRRRDINYATTQDCQPTIPVVSYVPGQFRDDVLKAAGFARQGRAYVTFDEANYCGMAQPGSLSSGGYAYVGKQCWTAEAATHELFHLFGAVRADAPGSQKTTPHCIDGRDIMCYADPTPPFTYCYKIELDCRKDTYFDARRVIPKTSYLYRNPDANTANAWFLLQRR